MNRAPTVMRWKKFDLKLGVIENDLLNRTSNSERFLWVGS